MALIVETGLGVFNADSYVGVDEADAYHLARGNELWGTIDPTRKENLLRQASDYITYIFGRAFIGGKAFNNQSLAFPRTQLAYYGNVTLISLGVPVAIREATSELALIAQTTPLMPTIQRGKRMVKVGSIQVEYDAQSFTGKRFVAATARLAEFMRPPSGGVTMAKLIRT